MEKADRIAEETALRKMMEGFISSYTVRDQSVDFPNWLAQRLQQEMPGMSSGASERLSGEIIEGVKAYDQTLSELNAAIESGQSKEEWLAERTVEACVDMPPSSAGNSLSQVYDNMNTSNAALMEEIEEAADHDVTVDAVETVDTEIVEWNEYSVKSKALDIGKQAVMSGLGVAADVIKRNIESGEAVKADEVIGQALQGGLKKAKGEVKAVVAGAIKTAAENGLSDILPADTPVETICDMAGAAVETAGALFDAATGEIGVTEALDKAGRAGVAAGCRGAATLLKGALASIPYVGPIVALLAGGLLDHMKSPKFTENVYTVVRDAAKATWEGIKQVGRNIFSKVINVAERLFN